MRIAAIFIYSDTFPHIFGEKHEEITLNLGGRYLYEAHDTAKGVVILEEKENGEFIQDFWGKNLNNVSAIVGANGSGKSTILHHLKEGGFRLICESDGEEAKILSPSDAGLFIYYSPYLSDAREEYDRVYTRNLSKLSLFKKDTPNEPLDLNTHLELHNSEQIKRIISFVNSDIFSEDLQNLKIPSFQKIKIKMVKISKEDWNSSRNFQPFFKAFEELKEKERIREETKLAEELGLKKKEDFQDNKAFVKENKEYKRESRKLRLKLDILDSIIRKIHSILERSGNKYLEEGFIESEFTSRDSEFTVIDNLKDAFYWFLNKAFIQVGEKIKFPITEIKDLTELLLTCAEKDNNIENWTILTVNFEDCFKIIESYKNFLLSFKGNFSYDSKTMLLFEPDVRLSTGEMAMYELFSVLFDLRYSLENNLDNRIHIDNAPEQYANYFLLLDEADLGFHPTWKRMFVKSLVSIIPKIFPDKNLQIILTTHSPLSLSDIPSNNMVLLSKDLASGTTIVASNDDSRINSFGANINDLLSNSFFLEDYLIGDFAKDKIEEVIAWIKANKDNDEFNRENYERMQKIISLIEEPVLRNKLTEMLSEVEINEEFINEMIEKETAYLRSILKRKDD